MKWKSKICVMGIAFVLLSGAAVQADTIEDHAGHVLGFRYDDYVSPVNANITIAEDVLKYSRETTNETEEAIEWTISDTAETTHSWNVGGSLETTIQSGLLAKAVADGHVKVSVGTNLSGSEIYSRTVSFTTTIPICRKRKYCYYLDVYDAVDTQWQADCYWYCIQCDVMGRDNLKQGTGTGHGDDSPSDVFKDLGAFSQSDDPCIDCYKNP